MGELSFHGKVQLTFEGNIGEVSDGYHTFNELYEHRCLLFIALMRAEGIGWISKKHQDGTMFDGWFIAGLHLATGDITYHLPLRLWDLCLRDGNVIVLEKAPSWDGHTPNDVIKRLALHLEMSHEGKGH